MTPPRSCPCCLQSYLNSFDSESSNDSSKRFCPIDPSCPCCLQSYLNSFDSESLCSGRADGFPPLHVSRFGDALLHVLFFRRFLRVNFDHLLIHVLLKINERIYKLTNRLELKNSEHKSLLKNYTLSSGYIGINWISP